MFSLVLREVKEEMNFFLLHQRKITKGVEVKMDQLYIQTHLCTSISLVHTRAHTRTVGKTHRDRGAASVLGACG